MALPKLETPTYTLTLPSTGEEVKYRPFLVKEQKQLMIILNIASKVLGDYHFQEQAVIQSGLEMVLRN